MRINEAIRDVVVIYPGRFHPFHKGHASVYEHLRSKFSKVFIATSNKIAPPKSPFSFEEKRKMMLHAGIPASFIVQTKNPYQAQEILANFDPENTSVIFAVSQKDMAEDPRFSFRPRKDGSPSFFQPLPKNPIALKGFEEQGYIYTVPTLDFKVLGKPMRSATQLRAQFADADSDTRKEIVKDLYGSFDTDIYKIMQDKLTEWLNLDTRLTTLRETLDDLELLYKFKNYNTDKIATMFDSKLEESMHSIITDSITKVDKDNVMNSIVAVPGIGAYSVSTLMAEIRSKMTALSDMSASKDPSVFRNMKFLFDKNIVGIMLDALVTAFDDLEYIRKKGGLSSRSIPKNVFDSIKNMNEGWSKKYKDSINCSNPKGFSQKAHCAGRKKKTNEDIKYVKPQFDVEWEEANRYPYFDKLGKAGWEELAGKGKIVKVNTNSVKKIGNTGADGSESLDDLEPDKVARLKKAMDSGTIEMPIVVKQPDGSFELVAGNTRLIGLINTQGEAKVWLVDASRLDEKITKRTPMGDVIDDFYKSDAPQFKGKSKAKRRQMAVAAKLAKMDEGKDPNYHLRLERDNSNDMMVLHIKELRSGNRTEVRGKSNYETTGYDPKDPLHILLDKIGKAANISELMNGEVVSINPKHPEGAKAKQDTEKAFNEDSVKDVKIDNKNGWGAVPNNLDIDYLGMRVKMKPSVFEKLALSRRGIPAVDAVIQHIKSGGSIGAPYLIIRVDEDDSLIPEVVEHDGRSRMLAIAELYGDVPVEVHLFFRGKVSRARHITTEFKQKIQRYLISQNDEKISGPLFSESINENKRVPRKKGQKANSKKHSDLYTDENPKGTIHGLKFATVKDAEASVRKIKSSGKKHAHKIQAAIAMEQRAKAAGKKSAAAVYRRYINAMKKKTKKMNEIETMSYPQGKMTAFNFDRSKLKTIGKLGDYTLAKSETDNYRDSDHVFVILKDQAPKGELVLNQRHKEGYWTSAVRFEPEIQGKGLAVPLYVYAIRNGYDIVSDDAQSKGSQKLWQKLSKVPGINVYAWDQDENKFFNWDPDEDPFASVYFDTALAHKIQREYTAMIEKSKDKDERERLRQELKKEIADITPKNRNTRLVAVDTTKKVEEQFIESAGVGRVVKGVNTTDDVGPNEIAKQAAKFGNKVDKDGRPPELHKKARKNSDPNKLYNLGLTEEEDKDSILEAILQSPREGIHMIIRKTKDGEKYIFRTVLQGKPEDPKIVSVKDAMRQIAALKRMGWKLSEAELKERGISIPLASGNIASVFPHRPLKIKKSTPGRLRYDQNKNKRKYNY